MASKEINLSVNDTPIKLDYFVEGFIDQVVGGIIAGLKGTEEIEIMDISIEADEVSINLNNDVIPVNLFASKIIRSTIFGMVSPLKGVSEINRLVISIKS